MEAFPPSELGHLRLSNHHTPQGVSESSLGATPYPSQTLNAGKGAGSHPFTICLPCTPWCSTPSSVNSGLYQVVDTQW